MICPKLAIFAFLKFLYMWQRGLQMAGIGAVVVEEGAGVEVCLI